MRSVFQHNGSSEMTVARSQAVATILMKYLSIKNEYENGWRTAMNRSKVMQQWFAIPDNRITEIRYPLATDSWIMRITGNIIGHHQEEYQIWLTKQENHWCTSAEIC